MSRKLTDRDIYHRSISETTWQGIVIGIAHACGWRVAHFRKVRIQRANGSVYYATPAAVDGVGYPDLCLVRGEQLIYAELKAELGKVEPEQAVWIDALRLAVPCYVWRPSDADTMQEVLA